MLTDVQRAAVIAEAKTWIGTPYHHMGRVKGAGVDCAMLLAEVYERAGIVQHVDIPYYPSDWHLNRDVERYLGELVGHAHEVGRPPQPADIVVVKFGRTYSHGAIVVAWPLCIHALMQHQVGFVDAVHDAAFRENNGALRDMKFFSVGRP